MSILIEVSGINEAQMQQVIDRTYSLLDSLCPNAVVLVVKQIKERKDIEDEQLQQRIPESTG